MQEFFKTETIQERVLLIGVRTGEADDTDGSLDELEELVKTAGALTVGRVIQNREAVHPTTYIGKGKIDEVRALAAETDASGVVCDDELSPVQLRELEDELQMKVMDRTLVILDIFAGRATTSEGKIQVELAQLKYRLTRLTGLGRSLSRLGGGIGTRGPGEKKLEMDRRLIRDRIAQLNRELKEVKRHREVTRTKREKQSVPVAAIVGYTNAGKSTLLNTLTDAGVLEEDNGILRDFKADRTLPISARTGQGLDELKELLGELLRENKVYVERILSYANAGLVNLIRGKGELLSEAYEEDGIHVKAYVPMEIYHLL